MKLEIAKWLLSNDSEEIVLPSGDVLDNRKKTWKVAEFTTNGSNMGVSDTKISIRNAQGTEILITFYCDNFIPRDVTWTQVTRHTFSVYRRPKDGPAIVGFFKNSAVAYREWSQDFYQTPLQKKVEFFDENGNRRSETKLSIARWS